MTAIPIRRNLTTRKGWYRATFNDGLVLLVPIAWTGHFRFQDLLHWPNGGKWEQLTYVPAPRRPEPVGRVML